MIPWVTDKLVANGTKIFSIEPRNTTLEDVFLTETEKKDTKNEEEPNDIDEKNVTNITNIYNINDSVINRSNLGKENKKKK